MRRYANLKAGRLTRRAFKEMFGFFPRKPLTKRQRQRADEINKLFDLVRVKCGITSFFIFKALEVDEKYPDFSRNVRTCPKKVLEFCRAAIAPNSWLVRR